MQSTELSSNRSFDLSWLRSCSDITNGGWKAKCIGPFVVLGNLLMKHLRQSFFQTYWCSSESSKIIAIGIQRVKAVRVEWILVFDLLTVGCWGNNVDFCFAHSTWESRASKRDICRPVPVWCTECRGCSDISRSCCLRKSACNFVDFLIEVLLEKLEHMAAGCG